MAFSSQEQIDRDLAEKDTPESEFQKKVLEYVKPLLKASSDKMSRHHLAWENYDWIYRGYRINDREDKEAAAKGEPSKIIVPLTFAQVQTAISFLMATYLQRNNFYEFRGMGSEDDKLVFGLETDISYQLSQNAWPLKLYYFLLDTFKYGFGVIKTDWDVNHCYLRTQKRVPIQDMLSKITSLFGKSSSREEKYEIVEEVTKVLKFEGNRIRNVSPFAFYPDPNLPIAKFQDGSFVCHEEERSLADVKRQEDEMYFGTDKIPESMSKELFEYRSRWAGREFKDFTAELGGVDKTISGVVLSETQFIMSGKDLNKKFDLKLEPKDYQAHWSVVVGNDAKIIQFKPLGYLHNQFTYDVAEYSPDANSFYNPGLSETIQELQSLITFFLNSHVINVKKLIKNRFIGDPQYVNVDDVKKNEDFIRMQGNPPGDIDRFFKQLSVTDATRGHVQDMDTLAAILQQVSGVNENALGQYASGRRSATEARNVSAGSAARLKMHGTLIWYQGLEPAGKKMVSNTRQGRSMKVYEQIIGKKSQPYQDLDKMTGMPVMMPAELPYDQVIMADPDKIAGGYDFLPFDGTLPSDRQQLVTWLTELYSSLMGNEQAMIILQKDPTKLLKYIAQLLNIKNLEDFNLTPDTPLMMPQPQVVPDAEAAQAVDRGASPVDMTMGGFGQ